MGKNSNNDNSQIIDAISTNQLERYHRNKKIDKDLIDLTLKLQCAPIDKQLTSYEEFTKKLVSEDELIRDYIYRTALDKHFNMIPTIANMPDSFELMLTSGEKIGKMKYLIDDEIRENGGEYLYYKKNRKELLERYANGIPPWIKSIERFHNLGAIIQDLVEFINAAGPIDQIKKIKVFKAKMSFLFPEDEMKVKHAEDIPPEIKRFNSLLDKIEELEKINSTKTREFIMPEITSKMQGDIDRLKKDQLILTDICYAIALLDFWEIPAAGSMPDQTRKATQHKIIKFLFPEFPYTNHTFKNARDKKYDGPDGKYVSELKKLL